MAERAVPDLGDLARVHWEPWLPRRGRARGALLVACAVLLVGLVALVPVVVVTDGPGELWRVLPHYLPLSVPALTGRQGVELGPEGVRRRHGVVRRAWRPWSDVVEVRPTGRWDLCPVAVLDGDRLDLRGLAAEDAERLAAALARAREARRA